MLVFNDKGIYCPQAGVYIDPWKPVDKAIITHAHSDHARAGMNSYLSHKDSIPVLQHRIGPLNAQGVEYGETFSMNGVNISLHPAGHIWGSAQVRLEYKGEVWVVSGDYKLREDGISAPFEILKCDHFITESTFGLPIYQFPPAKEQHDAINAWWKQNRDEGKNTVLLAYSLGKAQRVHAHLDPSIGPIYTHGAIDNINKIYEQQCGPLPFAQRISQDTDRKKIQGALILAPPSAAGTAWMQKLKPYRVGVCSGWMQLRGARRRRGADRGFPISDHADWNELNTVIRETGASHIYVTHGYKSLYAKWLRAAFGVEATEIDTLYSDVDELEENESAPVNEAVNDESIQ